MWWFRANTKTFRLSICPVPLEGSLRGEIPDFEKIMTSYEFGASGPELGASDADAAPGLSFHRIWKCNFKHTSLGASGADLGASGL